MNTLVGISILLFVISFINLMIVLFRLNYLAQLRKHLLTKPSILLGEAFDKDREQKLMVIYRSIIIVNALMAAISAAAALYLLNTF